MLDDLQPSPALLALPPMLDLRAAPNLLAALLAQRGTDLVLDGSEVRHLGGQGLQVLLAAQAAWAADGKRFQVEAPSAELVAGAALLGASGLLGGVPA